MLIIFRMNFMVEYNTMFCKSRPMGVSNCHALFKIGCLPIGWARMSLNRV